MEDPRDIHIIKPTWVSHRGVSDEKFALKGVKYGICCVAIDGTGQKFLTGGTDGSIRLWSMTPVMDENFQDDPNCQKRLFTSKKHNGSVNSIAWSHCNKYFASASSDKSVIIWRLEAGVGFDGLISQNKSNDNDSNSNSNENENSNENSNSNSVDIHNTNGQNKYEKIKDDDKTNIKNWQAKQTLLQHELDVQDVAWSPDDSTLVTVSVDEKVRIFELQSNGTFRLNQEFHEHRGIINGVAWDPMGKFFCTQSADGSCLVWEYNKRSGAKLKQRICKEFRPRHTMATKGDDSITREEVLMRPDWTPDGQYFGASFGVTKNNIFISPIYKRDSKFSKHAAIVGHKMPTTVTKFNPRLFGKPRAASNKNKKNKKGKGKKSDKREIDISDEDDQDDEDMKMGNVNEKNNDENSDNDEEMDNRIYDPFVVCAVGSMDCGLSIFTSHKNRQIVTIEQLSKHAILDISWSPKGNFLLCCTHDGDVFAIVFGKRAFLGNLLSMRQTKEYISELYGRDNSIPTENKNVFDRNLDNRRNWMLNEQMAVYVADEQIETKRKNRRLIDPIFFNKRNAQEIDTQCNYQIANRIESIVENDTTNLKISQKAAALMEKALLTPQKLMVSKTNNNNNNNNNNNEDGNVENKENKESNENENEEKEGNVGRDKSNENLNENEKNEDQKDFVLLDGFITKDNINLNLYKDEELEMSNMAVLDYESQLQRLNLEFKQIEFDAFESVNKESDEDDNVDSPPKNHFKNNHNNHNGDSQFITPQSSRDSDYVHSSRHSKHDRSGMMNGESNRKAHSRKPPRHSSRSKHSHGRGGRDHKHGSRRGNKSNTRETSTDDDSSSNSGGNEHDDSDDNNEMNVNGNNHGKSKRDNKHGKESRKRSRDKELGDRDRERSKKRRRKDKYREKDKERERERERDRNDHYLMKEKELSFIPRRDNFEERIPIDILIDDGNGRTKRYENDNNNNNKELIVSVERRRRNLDISVKEKYCLIKQFETKKENAIVLDDDDDDEDDDNNSNNRERRRLLWQCEVPGHVCTVGLNKHMTICGTTDGELFWYSNNGTLILPAMQMDSQIIHIYVSPSFDQLITENETKNKNNNNNNNNELMTSWQSMFRERESDNVFISVLTKRGTLMIWKMDNSAWSRNNNMKLVNFSKFLKTNVLDLVEKAKTQERRNHKHAIGNDNSNNNHNCDDVTIGTVYTTQNGYPIIILSNDFVYYFEKDLDIWLRISDDCFWSSQLRNQFLNNGNDDNVKNMNGHGNKSMVKLTSSNVLNKGNKRVASLNFASKQSNEKENMVMLHTLAHIEQQIAVCSLLQDTKEFEKIWRQYVNKLIFYQNYGSFVQCKMQELCGRLVQSISSMQENYNGGFNNSNLIGNVLPNIQIPGNEEFQKHLLTILIDSMDQCKQFENLCQMMKNFRRRNKHGNRRGVNL